MNALLQAASRGITSILDDLHSLQKFSANAGSSVPYM